MDCAEYYETIYKQQGVVLCATFSDPEFSLQAVSHEFLEDLQLWIDSLGAHPETGLFAKAKYEFQAGLNLLTLGHYRYAFVSLRSCLELGVAGIWHSASLLEHFQWKNGRRDIVWANIIDKETGVFSEVFCREFAPGLVNEVTHVGTLATTVYRTCSQYAHGNPIHDATLPQIFEFSSEMFRRWHEAAKSARYVVLFALTMRYLAHLSDDALKALEQCLQDHMSHHSFVREILAGGGG